MTNFLKKKRTVNDIVAFSCFFIYGLLGVFINSYIVETDMARLVVNILRILVLSFLFYDATQKFIYKNKELTFGFFVAFILSLLIFAFSKNYQLIFFVFFIYWVSSCKKKAVIQTAIISHLVGIFIVIILATLGVIKNIEVTRYMETSVRYGLGFIAPALASGYLLHVLLAEMVLYRFKLKTSHFIFYAVFNLLLFYLTDTRFETIIIFGLLLISFIFKYVKTSGITNFIKNHKKISFLFVVSPIIFFGLNVLLLIGYKANISLFVTLADKMSSRVQYTISAFRLTGLSLFGKNVDFAANGIVLDSSYFKVLLEYGIAGLVILFYCYCKLINKAIKRRNLALFVATMVIVLENIFSPFALDYNYNIIILLSFGAFTYRRRLVDGKENDRYSSCYIQPQDPFKGMYRSIKETI